jgi:hypothetical protein
MIFPEWAPAKLVEEYERLQDDSRELRQWQAQVEAKSNESLLGDLSDWDEVELQEQLAYWREKVVENDKLAAILFRLLTNVEMKAAWTEFIRHRVEIRIRIIDRSLSIWLSIVSALEDFPILISNASTPANKRKSLKGVITKAQALLDAINTDPVATGVDTKLMSYYLAIKNNNYRQDMGESFSEDGPFALGRDCDQGWHEGYRNDIYEMVEDPKWEARPLISRLAYWAREAEQVKLTQLLPHYIEFLKAQAEHPPEIKQPGRAEAAVKPFLIRRLSRVMDYYCGQPLDDVVAKIVSIVLNLETPLTRDDIRPYVKVPGRN